MKAERQTRTAEVPAKVPLPISRPSSEITDPHDGGGRGDRLRPFWPQTWLWELRGEDRPGHRLVCRLGLSSGLLPRPHGKPAVALEGERCGDYSLETSLQAREIHTLFFIISFKMRRVSGPSLSAEVTQRKERADLCRGQAARRRKKRGKTDAVQSQETRRGRWCPGHRRGSWPRAEAPRT